MKASVLLTILTSASASLCCIVPFLGLLGGSSGLISTVSWLEPFRPFFIAGTFLILGFAWYRAIKASKKDDCGCGPQKPSFVQSKKFLSVITVVSLLLISFPSFSRLMIRANDNDVSNVDQERNKKITLTVTGMTCASCERHIETEVIKLSGVSSVNVSYFGKSATIEYSPEKVDKEKIIAAINNTGYRVEQNVNVMQETTKGDCCTKGTCTPETCKSMQQAKLTR